MKIIILFSLFSFNLAIAQAVPQSVPESYQINNTNPANLSWIVAEFKVTSLKFGKATLEPTKISTLPTIEVKYTSACMAQYNFKEGGILTFVIRDGYISQVFSK